MSWLSGLLGGGGGSSSTSTSWSQTIQMDQRVAAEDAELVAGAGAAVSLPGSVAIAGESSVGDIVIQQFTPEVQKTVGQIVEAFSETTQEVTELFMETSQEVAETFAERSQEVTEVLGEKLLTTQQGVASILPEMAKYMAIAVVAIIVVRKVWK